MLSKDIINEFFFQIMLLIKCKGIISPPWVNENQWTVIFQIFKSILSGKHHTPKPCLQLTILVIHFTQSKFDIHFRILSNIGIGIYQNAIAETSLDR